MINDASAITQNPFAVITIIAAPAILTNASALLSLSTSNRLMRCLDRINEFNEKLEAADLSDQLRSLFIEQLDLSHQQSKQFLRALRAIYISLASFAGASFIALAGAATTTLLPRILIDGFGLISFIAGGFGALGFVWASFELIRASRITVRIMSSDLQLIQKHRAFLP